MIVWVNLYFHFFSSVSDYIGGEDNIQIQNSLFDMKSFFFFFFYFILLYNTVLVLPYIDMNPPRVYTSSQSWIPLPPFTPYHLSGSSPCTSPKHPASCIEHRLALRFLNDSIHVSMPFSQIIPPSPSPQSPKVRSTHLCLFCCICKPQWHSQFAEGQRRGLLSSPLFYNVHCWHFLCLVWMGDGGQRVEAGLVCSLE